MPQLTPYRAEVFVSSGCTHTNECWSLSDAQAWIHDVTERCVRIPHARVICEGKVVYTQQGGARFDAVAFYEGRDQE